MTDRKKRIKNRLPYVVIFLLFLTGIGIYLYPTVSNWIFLYTSRVEIAAYDDITQNLDASEIADLEKEAQDYNASLAQGGSDAASSVRYGDLLAVTDALGYVDIPKLEIYLPIFHGTSEEALQMGIGHMEGTSLPIGGESTHSVLAGHTGLPTAELFTNIDRLVPGDVFYIHVLDRILAYRVDQTKVVEPAEDEEIQIVQGEDYVTLLTCTPYGVNDHRLLVRGTRIPYTTPYDPETQDAEYPMPPSDVPEQAGWPLGAVVGFWSVIGLMIVIAIVLLILFLPVKKKKFARERA